MKPRRARSEDVLFISALAAILLGIGFLLFTTNAYETALRAWPILVIAAGGCLLYVALVRRASSIIFFGGLLFVLEGGLFLLIPPLGWTIRKAWPLVMSVAGLVGLVTGLARWRKPRAAFIVPSVGFALLGLIFSAFSFGMVGVNFGSFVSTWWPTLLIAGGVSLFVAYGLSPARGSRRRPAKPRSPDERRNPARGRGSDSGS